MCVVVVEGFGDFCCGVGGVDVCYCWLIGG